MRTVSESRDSSATAVFILGMHRSGTSAITQAVKVLGFELSENLMPAKPDNVKGFWEDWDVVNLNERILRSDTGSWDRLSLFDQNMHSPEELEQLISETTQLLQRKFNDVTRFAIKDPRISLILPLWREACTRQLIEPTYILCLRHPSSIASSLASRNEMPAKKALLLWLNHVYSILRDCRAPLLVVGYESILSDPHKELRRIAQFLGVTNNSLASKKSAISHFTEQFLDRSLDHFRVDRLGNSNWLSLVDGFYRALSQYQDRKPLTPDQQNQLLKAFYLDDQLLIELNDSASASRRQKVQGHNLDAIIEGNRTLIDSLEKIGKRLPHLDADGVKAAAELAELRSELAAVKADRANVDADRQRIDIERIKLLEVSLMATQDKRRLEAEYKVKDNILHKTIDELTDVQDQLRNTKTEMARVQELSEQMSNELDELRAIRASRIWRMTAPVRWMLNSLYHLPAVTFLSQHRTLTLQPINHLVQRSEHSWTATDHDPQFILLNNRYPVSPGSYKITLTVKHGEELLAPRLYFDYGAGFRDEDSVALATSGRTYKAPVILTDPVYQLRLDPYERKGTFSIIRIRWRPVSKLETLIRLMRHVIRKNRARGLTLGETFKSGFNRAMQEGWSNIWRNTERYFPATQQPTEESISYEKWINTWEQPYRSLRYGEASRPLPIDTLPVIVFDYEDDAEAVNRTINSLVQQRTSFDSILLLSSKNLDKNLLEGNQIQHCQEPDKYSATVEEFANSLDYSHMLIVSAGNMLSHCFSRALAIRLFTNPSARLIYTDSDRLSHGSKRVDPEFKPNWNPDFELAAHYVGDTFVIASDLVNKIPPDWLSHRQDALYSLLATAAPLLDEKNVEHIPEVLWHKSGTAKASTNLGRIKAIFAGIGDSPPVTAVETETNSRAFRLRYHLPKPEPLVDIIIPTKDQCRLLKLCIDSVLAKTVYGNYRIVVVDNGSTEDSTLTYLEELRQQAQCSVLPYPHPFNYSAINNFAVSQSTADVVVLMNNDIEVISPDWLQEMVSHAIRPEVGCVGAKLYYPDGRIQHAGVILGIHGVAGHCFRLAGNTAEGYLERLHYVQNYSAVTGACLAVQRDIYQEVGGLNDQNLAVAFNDIDFCLKVREAGYRNLWTPYAELHHHESATRGEYDDSEKLGGLRQEAAYMTQRWGELLINDPAYNPNLSLSGTGFELSTRYVGGVSPRKTDTEVSISEHPYSVEPNISRVNQVLRLSKTPASAHHDFKRGLSIVILTLEKLELIKPLLERLVSAKHSFSNSDDFNLQIVVGDTGSRDKAVHALYQRLDGEITVVKEMKYNFSRCNNRLFKDHVIYDAVLFLNNDIIFSDPIHTLKTMYTLLTGDINNAVVGTYLLYPNKRLQHAGIAMFGSGDLKGLCYHPGHDTDFVPPNDGDVTDVPAVTGACLMMKSSQFVSCDYFDESYEAEAQDVDLCLKACRVGKAVQLIYCGQVIHHENATRPRGEANQRDRSRFIRKWKTYQEAIGFE